MKNQIKLIKYINNLDLIISLLGQEQSYEGKYILRQKICKTCYMHLSF